MLRRTVEFLIFSDFIQKNFSRHFSGISHSLHSLICVHCPYNFINVAKVWKNL
jgi:hypothetical protein